MHADGGVAVVLSRKFGRTTTATPQYDGMQCAVNRSRAVNQVGGM